MMPKIMPVTLTGRRVELQPLSMTHHDDLCTAVNDGELWRLTVTRVPTPEEMKDYITEAQKMSNALPFAIVDRATGRAVGSTRYAAIRHEHRGLEIGWTWLASSCQRTPINTEAKYLLLNYAFGALDCLRVELKTDLLNERSQRAIERIGGVREGIFRRHMVMGGGRVRDTVYYSIVDLDWPSVRARLEARLTGADSR